MDNDIPAKPPITIHVLDTLTGKPASNIPVTLTLLASSLPHGFHPHSFHALTSSKGRIDHEWLPTPHSGTAHSGVLHAGTPFSDNPNPLPLDAVFEQASGEMMWVGKFAVRKHFEDQGIKPFFPEVEIRFLTEGFWGTDGVGVERGQWHIPLLLGPHSFTVCRGS